MRVSKTPQQSTARAYAFRTDPRPQDFNAILQLHRDVYAREHGFDATFETHVAGPLSEFMKGDQSGGRLWLATPREDSADDAGLAGCIAIVRASETAAQLRWFVVASHHRGRGLGTSLLNEALAFSREQGYQSVFLWTVSVLHAAARLYEAAGFRKVEEHPQVLWGISLAEQRYEMVLNP
ncbi:MAG TPA: GNAT family N-acetyltransferase [Phycisphaerae bacterium]|nr:GNAT family N-acetyltransferase [Phycisphaerae bacterium]